jgi:LPXTG-site transpeptidase (sortase) family protein
MGGNRKLNTLENVLEKPWEFLGLFLGIFFLISVFLFAIDFFPEPVKEENVPDVMKTQVATSKTPEVQFPIEEPVRVVIKSIGVDTKVENPTSTDVEVLDQALLKGAARYPQSALLGENAGVFIFGHQSGLPVVKNQAFKAFNGLQNLAMGQEIEVYSATAKYIYRVTSVEHVSAENALIDFAAPRTLTLSTCDSFGKKTDRNVVKAELVSRTLIPQTNS